MRRIIGTVLIAVLAMASGHVPVSPSGRVVRPVAALTASKTNVVKASGKVKGRSTAGATKASFVARLRNIKARNPGFSEESCTGMFKRKVQLGGTVSPKDFVTGCDDVCDTIKKMKTFWDSGEMASYSCTQGNAFGCVYDGTPPVTMSGIGC